jgi:DNA-binding transcriptional MerR regulator
VHKKKAELTLEQLARSAGMTPRNVRSYQSRGLLAPGERVGRQVCYGHEHVARLRLIRALRDTGLSLKVIGDLLEQGTAEEELARLSREQLGTIWNRAARLPLTPALVERYAQLAPGGTEAMVEAGALAEVDGEVQGSAAMLGLAGALYAHGVDLDAVGRVILEAAHAAQRSAPVLETEARGVSEDNAGLLVQLAACAYGDVLARRLGLY